MSGSVLVARCAGVDEQTDAPCSGRLRFTWGHSEAPCDTCGGRCGIAVARWERVVAATAGPDLGRNLHAAFPEAIDERQRPICGHWEPLLGPCICGDPTKHATTT